MAKINYIGGVNLVGCRDPQAINFNPNADFSCNSCCVYPPTQVIGCTDPQATNFNPSANTPCDGCCDYGNTSNDTNSDFRFTPINPIVIELTPPSSKTCNNILVNFVGNVVYNGDSLLKEQCCSKDFIGVDVYWDGEKCLKFTEINGGLCEYIDSGEITPLELENRITCIDCDNFAWWSNLYETINGASLQDIDQELWDFLVSVITSDTDGIFNNGSFYVDSLTGEPILGNRCCSNIQDSTYTFFPSEGGLDRGVCLCDRVSENDLECECVDNIERYSQITSSIEGRELLLNIDKLISLGLTLEQANYVKTNFFNTQLESDGISKATKSRTLISNALYSTGGIYVCFDGTKKPTFISIPGGKNLKLPVETTESTCLDLGGFWDGVVCFCKPQEECNLTLQDIKITTTFDSFNEKIDIITFNGSSISQECCLNIASENGLSWVYKQHNGVFNCFKKDPSPCLPLEFNLNKELIKPVCENPLDISIAFNFGKPENPCFLIDGDDDIIDVEIIDEDCALTFDEFNNIVDYNSTTVGKKRKEVIEIEPIFELTPIPNQPIFTPIGIGGPITDRRKPPCCFNPNNPIEVQLLIKDDKNDVVGSSDIFSFNQVDTWFTLSTQFTPPTTGTTEGFNVTLQFISGINCCCTYDVFLDNFKFDCIEEEIITETIKNSCPGFNIQPVIDNKKSWVYNPGKLDYSGILDQNGVLTDNTIINNGEVGLIQGYGVVNRTFAPSPDADIPWRYTDYFNQSSVLEKHSNLVLNSKELYLTFNMCNIGGPCPDGYQLSGDTCYKYVTGCPDGYQLSGDTCYSGITTATTIQELVTEDSNPLACKTKLNLLQLEGYKKTFQNFWVQFVEQFVPATTIFVSGEKWCNRPDEICVQYDECDFDFEFVEGDVTITPNISTTKTKPVVSNDSISYESSITEVKPNDGYDSVEYDSTENGPINTETVTIIPTPREPGNVISLPSAIQPVDITQRRTNYISRLQPTETIIV
jgi:hypothetical protein